MFDRLIHGGLLCNRDGDKHIVLCKRRQSIHTDTHHIGVRAVLCFQCGDVVLVCAGAVPAGHGHGVPGCRVPPERICKAARRFGGVATVQQLVVGAGQRAQHSLQNGVCNAGRLIHHEQHIVFVEALHILGLGGGAGHRKPALFVAPHIDAGLCPVEEQAKYLAAFHPFCNLGPQHIVELLARRGCADHTGVREAGQEPKHYIGLKGRLANALSRTDGQAAALCNGPCCLHLPIVGLEPCNLPEKYKRVLAVQSDPLSEDVSPVHSWSASPTIAAAQSSTTSLAPLPFMRRTSASCWMTLAFWRWTSVSSLSKRSTIR